MSYDALKRGRDVLIAACNTSLSGYVITVSASHSVTVAAPRAVYRAEEARPMYPNVEISPPRGNLDSLSHGAIATNAEYWVIGNLSSGDPLDLDDQCMVYVTAIIRMASSMDSVSGAYTVEPVEFDFSPPVFTDDTTQKRSVGVLVRMQFAESV